jgi:hypothetical protein
MRKFRCLNDLNVELLATRQTYLLTGDVFWLYED